MNVRRKMFVCALLFAAATCAVFTGCNDDSGKDLSVKSVTLSPSSHVLKPGETVMLTPTIFPSDALNKNVVWESSDATMVSVDSNGTATAHKLGAAIITVTTVDGGETATSAITVSANDPIAVGTFGGEATAVEGVWEKYTVVSVNGQIYVPEGKTLTIEEGVEVIVSAAGQDANGTKVEFIIEGSLFCCGTADAPVVFTVPAGNRDMKTDGRHWGGIIGGQNCPAIVLDHTLIEYTGAITTASSPSVTKGLFKAGGGDGMVAFNTNNPSGKYVITRSTFRYTSEDAIYVQGGDCLFVHNLFYANGNEGGEAINVKAGCKVVAAFNVMYSSNTNALKLSNSGFGPGRALAEIHAYNNTIINSGWRRDPSKPKGGSIWAESGYVEVFNNLVVNCMFAAKAPNFGEGAQAGVTANSLIDYNFYASGTAESNVPQHVQNGTVTAFDGFKPGVKDVYYGDNNVFGTAAGDNDPKFESFPFLTNPASDIHYNAAWDLHLKADSPALNAGKTRTGFTPMFAAGISINGKTYPRPAPANYFGAFGTK